MEEITIRRLNFLLECDVDLFKRFYSEVFEVEFPNNDERESLEGFLEEAGKSLNYKNDFNFTVFVAVDKDFNPIGGLVADYYRRSLSCLIEFEVIRRDYQSKGIGRLLFSAFVNDAENHFFREWNCSPSLIFWETEDEEYCKANNLTHVRDARWRYFSRLDAFKVDVDYVQPALDDTKNPVVDLDLCACLAWRYIGDRHISKMDLELFLKDYHNFSIASSEEHKSLIRNKILKECEDEIKLISVINTDGFLSGAGFMSGEN